MPIERLAQLLEEKVRRHNLAARVLGALLGSAAGIFGLRASRAAATSVACCNLAYPNNQCASPADATYVWYCCDSSSGYAVTACYENYTTHCSLATQDGRTC